MPRTRYPNEGAKALRHAMTNGAREHGSKRPLSYRRLSDLVAERTERRIPHELLWQYVHGKARPGYRNRVALAQFPGVPPPAWDRKVATR